METRLKAMYRYLQLNYDISTQEELAKKIGANRAAISAAMHGDSRYCNARMLHRINAAFGNPFSAEWIETGTGAMVLTPPPVNHAEHIGGNNTQTNTDPTIITAYQKQIETLLNQQSELLKIITNLTQQKP